MTETSHRGVAFYLPQFHPVSENDEWWEPGFTEWTNVTRARPLFRGHKQPHLPRDLGFYDLRVPETRAAQAALARRYGLAAFCYWHYWFAGRRLLQHPFTEVLKHGEPDFPFCLGWANQTWTGVWHGAPGRILVEQTYPGPDDDQDHFAEVLPAFQDPRYFRVDGKPLFYVFRPEQLPDPAAWVRRWRDMATAAGLPGLYLVAEVSDLLGVGAKYTRVVEDGWDVGAYVRLPAQTDAVSMLRMRARRKLRRGPEVYRHTSDLPSPPPDLASTTVPCVYPNWDHTPRTGRSGVVLTGSTPDLFSQHLARAVSRVAGRPEQEQIVFVKSWNEWAEGNYLEPDQEFAHGWLEALQRGLGARQ